MIERLPAPAPDNEEERPSGLLQIALNRRWYFLAPFFTIGLLGYAASNLLPLQYRSSAFIIVEQRKIPDQFVLPNVLMTLQRRLDAMTQQILSRTRLQRFIEDFNLYAAERTQRSMDDVIDVMQKRVSVELEQAKGSSSSRQGDLIGFRIFFSDRNPYMAQRVANELTSLFIEQDARERTTQSQETTAFLDSQLQEGQKQLAAEEEKMRQYKFSHLGELPAQQQSNITILSSLQAQLQASTAALERAEQQRIYLESMRSQQQALKSLGVAAPPTPETAPEASPQPEQAAQPTSVTSLEVAQSTLARLWNQLREVSSKYTELHPEVLRLKREIAEWETTVDRLTKERTADLEMTSRLKALLAEIETERRESAELRQRIREVQAQLSQAPIREQEMAELNRSYESAKTNVQSLLQKKQASELASNLEERQGGERFRLLDPATFPKKAEGRQKIVLVGWAIAFAAGAGLVFLREMLDKTVHKPADLDPFDRIPVFARIPTMRSPREERRRRRNRKLEIAAVAAMVLVSLASGASAYLQG